MSLFDRMPLPELRGPGAPFEAAWLGDAGKARTGELLAARRIANLSTLGVNLLQQRLVMSLTRFEVPTARLWEAFGHTYEEADLMEGWCEALDGHLPADEAAENFEAWIRADERQQRLKDPQQRAPIRAEMLRELRSRRTMPA